jgi:serine/threonine-protein kinase HipA
MHSYLEIAAAIEEQSARATDDLQQLWRRIAFSVLISNTDDHPRNHAFLRTNESGWRLSPAFDINPNPVSGPRELACAIDDADPTATVANIRRVAPYFRVDEHQASRILQDVGAAVSRWRDVAERCGLTEADCDVMAPAFDEHELASALA